MDRVLGVKEPPDGFTPEEKTILQLAGTQSVEAIYARLPTTRMKAIVALHFELGYDQEMLGRMFGVTQEQIGLDIRNIRKVLLGKPYHPHKPRSLTTQEAVSRIFTLANRVRRQINQPVTEEEFARMWFELIKP